MGREYHIVADGCVEKKFEVGVGECGVLAWCWGCCGVPGKPAWQPLRVWFHPLIACRSLGVGFVCYVWVRLAVLRKLDWILTFDEKSKRDSAFLARILEIFVRRQGI